MKCNGVIWRLKRNGEQYEAVISERERGQCELRYVRNGTLLHSLYVAAGRGLAVIEEALAERQHLKAVGWHE
jgi:hypothetical protein